MTDNEIIWAFNNGCDLLNNDDVDNEDLVQLKRCLEKCAEGMIPYVHKYVTEKPCKDCKNADSYGRCNKYNSSKCYSTIDRKYFERKKSIKR